MDSASSEKHIWKVPVTLDEIPETGRHFYLSADAATRAAIATELGLRSLERLDFSADVTRRGRDGLHVSGNVDAIVGQSCVVSLEPVENAIMETVDLDFVPASQTATDDRAESENADPPELLTEGRIDLGALAIEFLILGIDPYPRKSGAVFVAPGSDAQPAGPFASLASLKPLSGKGK